MPWQMCEKEYGSSNRCEQAALQISLVNKPNCPPVPNNVLPAKSSTITVAPKINVDRKINMRDRALILQPPDKWLSIFMDRYFSRSKKQINLFAVNVIGTLLQCWIYREEMTLSHTRQLRAVQLFLQPMFLTQVQFTQSVTEFYGCKKRMRNFQNCSEEKRRLRKWSLRDYL